MLRFQPQTTHSLPLEILSATQWHREVVPLCMGLGTEGTQVATVMVGNYTRTAKRPHLNMASLSINYAGRHSRFTWGTAGGLWRAGENHFTSNEVIKLGRKGLRKG